MRIWFVFLAFLVVAPPALSADKPVKLRVSFMGQPFEWDEPKPADAVADWAALHDVAYDQAGTIAHQLEYLAKQFGVADYGRLLLVRDLARRILVDDGDSVPRTFHSSLETYWNSRSRAVFVAAVLRRMGYAAVVFERDGKGLVGLAAQEADYNARTQRLNIERKFFGFGKSVDLQFLLWDVDGRIGDPDVSIGDAQMLTQIPRVFEAAELKRFDFSSRRVPESVYANSHTEMFHWANGGVATYNVYPDAVRYLSLYPEFHFVAQLKLERREFHRTGLGRAIAGLRSNNEETFVTSALRFVQSHFKYTAGPLRSVHAILQSRQGDCDQLAMVLALVLLESGYTAQDVAAVLWEDADHLGLLLRPATAVQFKDAVAYELGGRPYYVIDVTYYHRRESGELMTVWGEMNPDNRNRKATIKRIGDAS